MRLLQVNKYSTDGVCLLDTVVLNGVNLLARHCISVAHVSKYALQCRNKFLQGAMSAHRRGSALVCQKYNVLAGWPRLRGSLTACQNPSVTTRRVSQRYAVTTLYGPYCRPPPSTYLGVLNLPFSTMQSAC